MFLFYDAKGKNKNVIKKRIFIFGSVKNNLTKLNHIHDAFHWHQKQIVEFRP